MLKFMAEFIRFSHLISSKDTKKKTILSLQNMKLSFGNIKFNLYDPRLFFLMHTANVIALKHIMCITRVLYDILERNLQKSLYLSHYYWLTSLAGWNSSSMEPKTFESWEKIKISHIFHEKGASRHAETLSNYKWPGRWLLKALYLPYLVHLHLIFPIIGRVKLNLLNISTTSRLNVYIYHIVVDNHSLIVVTWGLNEAKSSQWFLEKHPVTCQLSVQL